VEIQPLPSDRHYTYIYRVIHSGEHIKKNEMAGAHSMNGGWKRCVEGFGGEPEARRPLWRPRHR
jgi:hypothetical protein